MTAGGNTESASPVTVGVPASGKKDGAEEATAEESRATGNFKIAANEAHSPATRLRRLGGVSHNAVADRETPLTGTVRHGGLADINSTPEMPVSGTKEPTGGASVHCISVTQSDAPALQPGATTTPADQSLAESTNTNSSRSDDEFRTESNFQVLSANALLETQSVTLAQLLVRVAAAIQSTRFDHIRPFISIKFSGVGSAIALPVALLMVVCLAWQYSLALQTRRTIDVLNRLEGSLQRMESGEIVVRIRHIPNERALNVLAGLSRLDVLDLQGTDLDDEQLKGLARLHKLRDLNLSNTQITDQGLPALRALSGLESLAIDGTSVSAQGLEFVRELPSLRHLSVRNTLMTRDGVDSLRKERPDLKVTCDDDIRQEVRDNAK